MEQMPQFLRPLVIIAGFVVVGYVIKLALNIYLTKLARRTKTKVDDIVVGALRTPIIIILALAGASASVAYIPLPAWLDPNYLHLGFKVLIVLVATACAVRISSGLIKYYATLRPNLRTIAPTVEKATKFLLAFFGLMVVLNILGISVTAPLAALGIGGIAVAFALQSTLADFLSGIYLMADRPIRVGDYVKLETGQEGYVLDIGWRSTRIRELPNNIIVIPNSKLANAVVVNYHMPKPELRVVVQVGVSYDSDLEKVERVTLEVAREVLKRVAGGVETFEPFLRYHTFADFSINFNVFLMAKEYVDKYRLVHEFIKELHKRYREEGIEIPFPIRTVYMRSSTSGREGSSPPT